ncbi:caspase family protein [Bradyrhizobium sp. LTSP885]|uniref:caspase family protein n=1 Tax=Bradyrhizobium sp. LTSP885 TaxID=1619232 RepID=UPI00069CB4A3|nr:caspase family protein [Bradyrhizobium sp. LTSP885]
MRWVRAMIVAVLAICASAPAFADKRVALVIGNSNYQSVAALPNPSNDAAAVTEMFRKAAFEVVESRRDLKYLEMRRALRDFTDKARGADIAVIYFAGHGLEVDGTNYLVPVDAALERDIDVDDEAVSLNRILLAAEPATKLRLVILDACRDNPFAKKMKRAIASRGVARGLVGIEASKPNTFIAFAAKEGSTASDGDGTNSPFSAALIKYLTRPGLDIRKAFGFVRDDVLNATGNQQEPYTTNSLGGNDVSLVPALAAPPVDPSAEIRRDYELAERVGTREAWDSFVATHPSGFYADLARAQRNKLAAEATRIAATEQARAAVDEKARLAAEGAKAAEQAKAAEKARVAEEGRLAAERQKLAEEAKVAAADQARRDADRKKQEAAERQKPAADIPQRSDTSQVALAAPSKDDQPAPAKPADAAVAAIPPAEKADRPSPADLPRLLQAELKRVGCKSGEVGGAWDATAQRALSSFNDKAGTKFDTRLASIDALDAVRAKSDRVCPLECERGSHPSGDRCIKITCDDGYVLRAGGSCQKRPEIRAQRERRAPVSGRRGGKCFVYNGSSFCE